MSVDNTKKKKVTQLNFYSFIKILLLIVFIVNYIQTLFLFDKVERLEH